MARFRCRCSNSIRNDPRDLSFAHTRYLCDRFSVQQGYVNHQLNKYSHVPNTSQMTGRDVAVGMLNYYGIQGVEVRMGREGQDFFNPKDNSITLGPDSYNGRSITATATACHEVGHACQFAQDYKPMKVRSALVPVVNLASNTWIFILLAGIILNVIGLVDVAIAPLAVAVLFQIVTLPVEFDASRRALGLYAVDRYSRW